MPRKVLIDKKTLQEILEKYQGGGSSSGGGSVENNIVDVCFAGSSINSGDELHLYMFKNDYQEWLENNDVTESELLSTFNNLSGLEQIGFLNNIGAHFNNIKSIYQAVKLHNNNSLKQAISCSYRIDDLENPESWSFSVEYISGPGPENTTIVYRDIDLVTGLAPSPSSGYDYASTLSVSTLDLVTGSSSGSTVEAEPIISIKMTNMDVSGTNQGTLGDLQFYCTKERWNNFVSLASTEFSLDITYSNLDTLFKQMDYTTQSNVLSYLLMDYVDGKILPKCYISKTSFLGAGTYDNYFAVEFLTVTAGESQGVANGDFGSGGTIPSVDQTTDYYTNDTVITVEEIAGPAIGTSSGSGDSPVLYKHSVTFHYNDGAGGDLDDDCTIELINNNPNSYGSGSTVFDNMIADYAARSQLQIRFLCSNTNSFFHNRYITNVDLSLLTDGTVLLLLNGFNGSEPEVEGIVLAIANITSTPVDTVTVYAQGAGSGSSENTGMQRWIFTFDGGGDVYINVYTKLTQSELSSMLADTNTSIDTINTMMGISLNHISSFDDIGTLITQSQTIDSTGALTETLIGTFMGGLCQNKKTISIFQDSLFGKRTVVNCYPTINNQIVTNYNCVIVNNSNQFVTLQIVGTNASAGYEEI